MRSVPVKTFLTELNLRYENEVCHLDYDKKRPWTLLFAVILSAQCTDERVNKVTPILFRQFPDLESYVARPIEDLERVVKPTGFFRNKAKSLKKCAEQLILLHNSELPDTMKELTELAGVGRKTANVILWNIFQKNEGVVVDTHVGRITQRLGITQQKNPITIEKDLMKKLPKKNWGPVSHQLIQLGRDICKAPTPICSQCFFQDICPKRGVIKSK